MMSPHLTSYLAGMADRRADTVDLARAEQDEAYREGATVVERSQRAPRVARWDADEDGRDLQA